jgi:nitrate reductase alpha subunit
MSMVSYAAGSRYLSLIGGVCMSFYDWYCDLPPSSPQTWGEQTDVPESADWYNSGFLMLWGSQRAADPHAGRPLLSPRRATSGTKTVSVTPDYSEASEVRRSVAAPEAGHGRRAGHGHGPCHPVRMARQGPDADYFHSTTAASTATCRCWCAWCKRTAAWSPSASFAPPTCRTTWAPPNNPAWKTVAIDDAHRKAVVLPNGSIGFRWGEQGKWNLEEKALSTVHDTELRAQPEGPGRRSGVLVVAFPYFGGRAA